MKTKGNYTWERRLIRALVFFVHITGTTGHTCRAIACAHELSEVFQKLGFVVRACVQKLDKGYEAIKAAGRYVMFDGACVLLGFLAGKFKYVFKESVYELLPLD